MLAKRIVVFGKVQSVGYRSKVSQIAASLTICGDVRNEPDGAVTIFAQGNQKNLQKFLKAIKII